MQRTEWLKFFISLELCLWLLALVSIVMGTGSFLLDGDHAATINSMPLLQWARETPLQVSWWLWLTLVLLALLVVNTLVCSWHTLAIRWGRGGWLHLLSPQLIHAGFLLVVVAHLISAVASSHHQIVVTEGMIGALPDGSRFGVASIAVEMSPMGMPTGYSSQLITDLANPDLRKIISPNHPWFSNGYGVYIKQAEEYPVKRALLEIHREPGAGMALAGAILFTVGNILLLVIRSRGRDTDLPSFGEIQ